MQERNRQTIASPATRKDSTGASPERARYHSSTLDINNLDENQDFGELPETYVIFITEKDYFGEGKPVYVIEDVNRTTGKPFNDKRHIIYVNASYNDLTTDIGISYAIIPKI
jgi:hypothetical protein